MLIEVFIIMFSTIEHGPTLLQSRALPHFNPSLSTTQGNINI